MSRGRKLTLVAGAAVVAALAAGLVAAGAIAASKALSPSQESKAVIDDAAAQLGVRPDALSKALKQALENRIDEAVKQGRLSKERGDELKKRIESDAYPLLLVRGAFGRFGFGFAAPPGFGGHAFRAPGLAAPHHFAIFDTAASYLGMTEAQLRDELMNGKTLVDIAKEKGKSVSGLVQAIVTAQEKRIDEAVSDGRLTKDQASALKANLDDRIESFVNGEFRSPGFGGRPHFWPGSGAPRAPPVFGGSSA
jgi:hypothetical protein